MSSTDGGSARGSAQRGSGWVYFAAALLFLGGIFKIADALWSFKYDDVYSEQVQTILFEHDLTSWGWLWLVIGVVLVAASAAVMAGSAWARWFGVVAGGVSAIVSYPWIFVEPLWTITAVTLSVLLVYALIAHGGQDVREPNA